MGESYTCWERNQNQSKGLWFIISIIFITIFLGWTIARTVKSYQFEIGCGGHLKRAADANNIPLAVKELNTAVDYAKNNNLTHGSTHLFIATPDVDVGFWYTNISESLAELEKVPVETTSGLEKSNLLMKLRETLLDHTQSGTAITVPEGISIYPNNWAFFIWCILSFVGMVFSLFVLFLKFAG